MLRGQSFDSLEPAVMEAYADTCELLSDKDGLHADAGHLQRTIAAEQALLKHSSVSPPAGPVGAAAGGRSRGLCRFNLSACRAAQKLPGGG